MLLVSLFVHDAPDVRIPGHCIRFVEFRLAISLGGIFQLFPEKLVCRGMPHGYETGIKVRQNCFYARNQEIYFQPG